MKLLTRFESIPDDGYNIDLMENDDRYETNHVWTYGNLKEELPTPTNLYDSDGPCLRRGIGEKFKRCIDAVAVCGGLDYNFFRRMAAISNQYAKMKVDSRREFSGYVWKNITKLYVLHSSIGMILIG